MWCFGGFGFSNFLQSTFSCHISKNRVLEPCLENFHRRPNQTGTNKSFTFHFPLSGARMELEPARRPHRQPTISQ